MDTNEKIEPPEQQQQESAPNAIPPDTSSLSPHTQLHDLEVSVDSFSQWLNQNARDILNFGLT